MNLEKIIEEYLPKFKEMEFEKYDEKWIKEGSDVDFGTKDGIKYIYEEIKKEIPPFKNKEELTLSRLISYLNGSKDRTHSKVDLSFSLFKDYEIMKMKNDYQIKQIIPNLEEIIRKIVQEEIVKSKLNK